MLLSFFVVRGVAVANENEFSPAKAVSMRSENVIIYLRERVSCLLSKHPTRLVTPKHSFIFSNPAKCA